MNNIEANRIANTQKAQNTDKPWHQSWDASHVAISSLTHSSHFFINSSFSETDAGQSCGLCISAKVLLLNPASCKTYELGAAAAMD